MTKFTIQVETDQPERFTAIMDRWTYLMGPEGPICRIVAVEKID